MRFVAFLIDIIVLYIFAFIIQFFFSPVSLKWIILFEFLAFPIFNLVLLIKYGATIGKWVMKIKVVNVSFRSPHLFQLLIRETLGKVVSSLFVFAGYIWIIFDDKRQAWHDKIAKTYVVYKKPISHEEYVKSQKMRKSFTPILLIIFGFLEPISISFVLFFLLWYFVLLYRSLYELRYVFLVLILGSALAQIVYGIVMIILQNKRETLSKIHKTIGFILLIFGLITLISIPCMILSTQAVMSNLKSQVLFEPYNSLQDIYTGKFTIQYPLSWKSEPSTFGNWGSYSNVTVKGKEGEISVKAFCFKEA